MTDDRSRHLAKVIANIDGQPAARRKRREHVTRKINGRPTGDLVGWLPDKKDFPLTITLSCGGRKIYEKRKDLPKRNVPCDCPDPNCYFLFFPKR